MRAGKNQQLHLMVEEIRQRIESLRKENHQKRQWLDVSNDAADNFPFFFSPWEHSVEAQQVCQLHECISTNTLLPATRSQ